MTLSQLLSAGEVCNDCRLLGKFGPYQLRVCRSNYIGPIFDANDNRSDHRWPVARLLPLWRETASDWTLTHRVLILLTLKRALACGAMAATDIIPAYFEGFAGQQWGAVLLPPNSDNYRAALDEANRHGATDHHGNGYNAHTMRWESLAQTQAQTTHHNPPPTNRPVYGWNWPTAVADDQFDIEASTQYPQPRPNVQNLPSWEDIRQRPIRPNESLWPDWLARTIRDLQQPNRPEPTDET